MEKIKNLYTFVRDGQIVNFACDLPYFYRGINNFYLLQYNDPDSLKNLEWLGYPEEGFWLTIFGDPPVPGYGEKVVSEPILDIENCLCNVSYSLVPMTDAEMQVYLQQKKKADFEASINAGYTIPNTNIILSITDQDRIAWNQFLSLINEMLNLGQIQLTSKISILDINGVPHEFTVEEVKNILAGLGYYYYTLWLNYNSSI